MPRLLIAVFMLAVLAWPAGLFAQDGGQIVDDSVLIDGTARDFRVYVPSTYDPAQPTPLVFMLHGLTSNVTDIEFYTEISQAAEAYGFLVVYPQARGGMAAIWASQASIFWESQDLRLMRRLLTEMQTHYTIDSARIYVMSYSNGGAMAHRMACDMAEQVAAIGVVGGTYIAPDPCDPARPVPVIAFHAQDDPVMPYEGIPFLFQAPPLWAMEWAGRNGCGFDPTLSQPLPVLDTQTWSDCREGAEVVFHTILIPSHNWPGGNPIPTDPRIITEFDANQIIWAFFAEHPRSD